jgi:UDP-N-acetylglucosamine--N-acetylmuramyl-(pentapeptide) pyrophosphoryl-undecaprenol N-acetylglucosamine transferase
MKPVILFAGGGTGGHVFPMIAVADAVRALAPDVEAVFVGTRRGLENEVVPSRGYELQVLDVVPMRGAGLRGFVRGAWRAARAIPQARQIVRRYGPRVVLSIGGYAAGSAALAARSLGIPVAPMEPNSEIGLANRLVAPFVHRAYTAFPESEAHFARGAVLRTGVPIRAGFDAQRYELADPARILVLGGSQGAASLNQAVPRAVARLGASVRVVHQAGRERVAPVRALYDEIGAGDRAVVLPFIDDMPAALASADLVVGRAGAGAVAEICAVGRPSILVPYPFAGDHQRFNARSLEKAGAAISVLASEATPEMLHDEMAALLGDPERLRAMAGVAASLGRPQAARVIARDLLDLAGIPQAERSGGGTSTNERDPTAPFALQEAE